MTVTVDEAGLTAPSETPAEQERRASFLELFFDLVFVFALTRVTALILTDTTLAGFGRAALVLGLVWWAWSAYAWMTNAIDIERSSVRVLLLTATAGSFVMALAVPHAYGREGIWFAGAYAFVQVLSTALYVWGLRADREHQQAVLRLAPWFVVGPALAVTGGLLEHTQLRTAFWLAALLINAAGTFTVKGERFRVSPSHFAERYGLFVIIALGESIVAIGVGAAEIERDLMFAIAVAVAFAGVAVLWWAYFDFTQVAAERALRLADPKRRGPLARDVYTLAHFPMVLGIILFAVAAEKTVAHPHDPLSLAGRASLGTGIALYLAGFVVARYRVVRRLAWERIGGAIAVLPLALALDGASAVWTLAAAVVLLLLAIEIEAARLRETRARIRQRH